MGWTFGRPSTFDFDAAAVHLFLCDAGDNSMEEYYYSNNGIDHLQVLPMSSYQCMWCYWLMGDFHWWEIWRREWGTYYKAGHALQYNNPIHMPRPLLTSTWITPNQPKRLLPIFFCWISMGWACGGLSTWLAQLLYAVCCTMLWGLGVYQGICIIINAMLLINFTPKLWYNICDVYVMFFWWSDINGCDGCKQYDIERQHGHDNQPAVVCGESICKNI